MSDDSCDLALERVTKQFGGLSVVNEISLQARRGEFLTLLGPSGCGKTTTLRLIAGFERPDGGRILLKGENVANVPANRRDVNTVFQHYALFPHLTVFENIVYPLRIRKKRLQEITPLAAEMIKTVDLAGFDTRFPHQLSGGQQQRVALARALINRPAVLLLDEPLGALDLQVRRRMQGELKAIQRRVGVTFIYVTHDQDEALTLSDRIAVMNKGRIEQLGTPREIYEQPANRFVLEFVGSANVFDGTVMERMGAIVKVVTALGTHLLSEDETGLQVGQTIVIGLRPEKVLLTPHDPPAQSSIGVVTEVNFQGASNQYCVRLDTGDYLWAFEQAVARTARAPGLRVGQQAFAFWSPSSPVLFPPSADATRG